MSCGGVTSTFFGIRGFSLPSLEEAHLSGKYNCPCLCHFGKRTCVRNHWKEISLRGQSSSWLASWGLAAAAKTLQGGGPAGIREALLASGCDCEGRTFLRLMCQNAASIRWSLSCMRLLFTRHLHFYFQFCVSATCTRYKIQGFKREHGEQFPGSLSREKASSLTLMCPPCFSAADGVFGSRWIKLLCSLSSEQGADVESLKLLGRGEAFIRPA